MRPRSAACSANFSYYLTLLYCIASFHVQLAQVQIGGIYLVAVFDNDSATWTGKVVLAEPDLFYSGGTIIIEHGYKVNTTYLHLSKLHVETGDTVKQGEVIGEVGATGRATGPHLDWRVNWGNTRLDPALLPQLYED